MGDVMKTVRIVREGEKAKGFKADQASFDALRQDVEARARKAREGKEAAFKVQLDKKLVGAKTSPSGIKYAITQPGTGGKPLKGAKVKAHYTGYLLDGTKFDSSVDRGQPFEFLVGMGQVIPGWDQTFLDMKKGEKRTIVIPPEQAYGSQGAGGVIPPNATLVFDVELLGF
jgi:peptidylprolyl isomerase